MATSEVRKIVRDRTWLEKARRVSNKTQKEVADAAGCSETFYNRIEKGLQMDALVKNGITIKDLEENYNKGYEAGFAVASGPVIKTCYAAVCLALNELHGFGMKRCKDVLNLVDEKILFSITSMEAIEEVWQKIGLQIDFNEVVSDRITEREDKNDDG